MTLPRACTSHVTHGELGQDALLAFGKPYLLNVKKHRQDGRDDQRRNARGSRSDQRRCEQRGSQAGFNRRFGKLDLPPAGAELQLAAVVRSGGLQEDLFKGVQIRCRVRSGQADLRPDLG